MRLRARFRRKWRPLNIRGDRHRCRSGRRGSARGHGRAGGADGRGGYRSDDRPHPSHRRPRLAASNARQPPPDGPRIRFEGLWMRECGAQDSIVRPLNGRNGARGSRVGHGRRHRCGHRPRCGSHVRARGRRSDGCGRPGLAAGNPRQAAAALRPRDTGPRRARAGTGPHVLFERLLMRLRARERRIARPLNIDRDTDTRFEGLLTRLGAGNHRIARPLNTETNGTGRRSTGTTGIRGTTAIRPGERRDEGCGGPRLPA